MNKIKDLTGVRIKKLIVIELASTKPTRWKCKCDCGSVKNIRSCNLTSKNSTGSCGCSKIGVSAKTRKNYTIGAKFNNWTVIGYPKLVKVKGGQEKLNWNCRCICGKERFVYQSSLSSGKSKSCGCINRLPGNEGAKRNALMGIKNGAKNRGYSFHLTEKQLSFMIEQECFYCGPPPKNKSKSSFGGSPYLYNGLDRLDNNKHYTVDNVVTSCVDCNLAKRKLNKIQFLALIKCIYERHLK